MHRTIREDGFALPLTILLITLLTIMLTASFVRLRSDVQIADGSGDIVTAFSVAQSGLQTYIGMSRDSTPPDGDSLRINVVGGYADVVAQLIRNDTPNSIQMYVVRSTGYVIVPSVGPEPRAVRTVAQFAQWAGTIRRIAALTSINKIIVQDDGEDDDDDCDDDDGCNETGVNTTVSGFDQCDTAPPISGVRAKEGSNTDSVTVTGNGSPPFNVGGSGDTVAAETGIDWDAIINNGAIVPDSDTLIPNDTTYKTYLVSGDLKAKNIQGTGLLIIEKKLKTDRKGDYFIWDGIVLLGDNLDAKAKDSTVIRGMLVTGLKELIAGGAKDTKLRKDLKVYYNSCTIRRALQSLTGLVPIRNAWIDNWASY